LLASVKQKQPLFEYFTKWFKVMFNGDWVEQSPLGKAEWIKFFALYGLDSRRIQSLAKLKRIQRYLVLAKATQTVLNMISKINGTYHKASWAALFLKDAQADYLWRDTRVLEVHRLLRLF
jgi:iron complex transport system substrate-binding protein